MSRRGAIRCFGVVGGVIGGGSAVCGSARGGLVDVSAVVTARLTLLVGKLLAMGKQLKKILFLD